MASQMESIVMMNQEPEKFSATFYDYRRQLPPIARLKDEIMTHYSKWSVLVHQLEEGRLSPIKLHQIDYTLDTNLNTIYYRRKAPFFEASKIT